MTPRPPLPPFTAETAAQKARLAEDAWNSRDPARVALAYTADSQWRNRDEFLTGRGAIVAFLTRKWQREQDYRLVKEVWAFHDHRIAVRFQYEFHDAAGGFFRAYGNEQWEFDEQGLMRRREASINDLRIAEADRRFRWPLGPRPADHPGLAGLGGPDGAVSEAARAAPPGDRRWIYKICPATEWQAALAAGVFRGSAVDLRDGFVHFSTGAQLAETRRRHFAGQPDLVLITVDPAGLGDRLRWEPSRGGDLFPHLYGALPVSLALRVSPIDADEAGVKGP